MFRWTRLLPIVMLVSGAVHADSTPDDVSAYLKRHGLDALLAVHLEDRLESVEPAERQEITVELIEIYARLLETTDDPAVRKTLEERSRAVLTTAPPTAGQELRLALLRGSYRRAESIAERHRLRQSSPDQVELAGAILTETIPQLTRLRGQIDSRARIVEQRLIRANSGDAIELARESEAVQRLYAQCTFIAAWALYYQSWLNDRPDNARAAEDLFAALLGAESQRPRPEDISVDLRALEPMARSILGMAMCKSMTSSSATAISWIELLEHERAFAELREQVPAWKMAVHLEHDEYRAARAILEALIEQEASDGGPEVPAVWIRLAAVHALEAEKTHAAAADLARAALAAMAARGRLPDVLDLAERYGLDALGRSGFAFRYVRGAQHYDGARQEHGTAEPTDDPRLAALYDEAIAELDAALTEADAGHYPAAAADCRWLIGWCRFFQGRFLEAGRAFDSAAEHLGAARAPEALWMAVVSLDKAAAESVVEPAQDALIDRFLSRYPDSPYAPKLRLKRALRMPAGQEVVEELLAIGPGSEVYDVARARAAQMLYELYRDAEGQERVARGNEYLSVAIPLLAAGLPGPDGGDAAALAYLARARRVLGVALDDEIGRVAAAGQILDALDELERAGVVDLWEYADEIDCRRVQERLLAADARAAGAIADRLWARGASEWARAAERALLRFGLARRKDGGGGSDDLELVVRHGRRLLDEYSGDENALAHPRVLALHAAVAEALLASWQRHERRSEAVEALALYERLLAARPRDAEALRATALLSGALGNVDQALACWRTLAAGETPGSERWYEARFNLVTLLAGADPDRARAVMDQHRQLNPDWGPEPWKSRFSALDKRLGAGVDLEPAP